MAVAGAPHRGLETLAPRIHLFQREPPVAPNLEGRQPVALEQPIRGARMNFQIRTDFLDGHNLAHGLLLNSVAFGQVTKWLW